jgi:ABC-type Fe3+-siderophore transport system permease subunit
MDIYNLIPEFLVLSLAGASLSIAAYSAFRDNNDDKKLLLIIAICFSFAFLVLFILAFTTLDNLNHLPYILATIFYILILMAILSIIGFIIHRLREDQKFRDDELHSAIDIIESSKDGLDSSISLFSSKKEE